MIRIMVGGLLAGLLGFIAGAAVGALFELAFLGIEPSFDLWELLSTPDYTVALGLMGATIGLFIGAIIGGSSRPTTE